MSLLNPGMPAAYVRQGFVPRPVTARSTYFGAEGDSPASYLSYLLWPAAIGLGLYALVRDDSPQRAPGRVGDYA